MKQTEIGMIPDDWEVKKLGELGSFSKGTSISKEESNSGNIPAIRYGELYTHHNNYIKTFYSHISSEVAKKAKQLKKGDLLFTCSGETKEDIGKCVAFISDKEAYAGSDLIILSPNIKIDSTYCGFLLNTDFCVRQKSSYGQGDAVVHISTEQIKKVKIPLPPTLAEQQKIAKSLSDVDNVISTLEKLITKKKNLKQGTMQQLLTGKKRLPGFAPTVVEPVETTKFKQTEIGEIPEDWEVKELGEFCHIKDGTHGTFSRIANGYLLLSAKNILDGKLEIQENESRISEIDYNSIVSNGFPKVNDILVSCVGTIGRCCIFNSTEKIAFQRSVAFIRQTLLDNDYLMYFIQSEIFQNQLVESVNASTLGGVYLGAFSPLNIFYPKSKTEQTAIANVLSSMDKEIEALNTKLEKYRNLKTGMMQQLLTGKIRLR